MRKKLSTLALCVLVAIVAFASGTLYSSATARPSGSSGRKYIGVVAEPHTNGAGRMFTNSYVVFEFNGEVVKQQLLP